MHRKRRVDCAISAGAAPLSTGAGASAARKSLTAAEKFGAILPVEEERRLKTHRNPDWELAIDPDTVRLFVLKARAIAAGVKDDYAAGNDREIELDDQSHDGHHHDGLVEEEADDLTAEELRELIADLNVDETAHLIALMWLGRGDYERAEWREAVEEARQRDRRKAASYLLGMPMLAEWLEDGLETLGA